MPSHLHLFGGGVEFYFKVAHRLHREMKEMMNAGDNEALGPELFLDAWGLRRRNPQRNER